MITRTPRTRRRLALAVLGSLAALVLPAAVGTAAAQPVPAPKFAPSGDYVWTAGPGGCYGPVRVAVRTDRAHPGIVLATYIPGPFSRPCTFRITVSYDTELPYRRWSAPITVGRHGGKPVTQTLRTGPGLHALGFKTAALHQPVAYYLIVP